MREMRTLLILSAIAVCLALPLVLRGYLGDDSQFHFNSWIGLRQAWLAGNFMPGWDSLANFTHGDARFCFYPPVSLWLGAFLALILPFQLVPIILVWSAFLISGLCMSAAAKSTLEPSSTLPAALLYMVSPYLVVTAITRFALAELLVLAWLPLIALHFTRCITYFDRRSTLILSALLGLSWLTNLPASIALAYVFLFTAVFDSIRRRSMKPLLAFVFAEFTALLIAAFSIAPAFADMGMISTAALFSQGFQEYLIFHSLSGLPRSHFLIGLWVIACTEAAIVAISLFSGGASRLSRHFVLYELAAAALLFQLPVFAALWVYAPGLRYVQFPFRFLSLLGYVVPLFILMNDRRSKFTWAAGIALLLLGCMPLLFYLRISRDTPSRLPDVTSVARTGYPGTGEYTPAGAITLSTPSAVPSVTPVSLDCLPSSFSSTSGHEHFVVRAQKECTIRLATYFYPRWQATDESRHTLKTARDSAGFLLVSVPSGYHVVDLAFTITSTARTSGSVASAAAILVLILGFCRGSCKTPGPIVPSESAPHHSAQNQSQALTLTHSNTDKEEST